MRFKDTSASYLWANMFGLPILQLCAKNQGEFPSPDFWPPILGRFFVWCDRSPRPHLCQIDLISVLRTGRHIGWPSQPVSHPSFPSFPVDARTGIAVGRRLRTAQDLRAENGGEVEGKGNFWTWSSFLWSPLKRASLLFVGNTINSPSKTGHLGWKADSYLTNEWIFLK